MMKKFLLFCLLIFVVGSVQAEVVFSDDFEGQTAGNPPGAPWSGAALATVVADDGSVFGSGNQYVNIRDEVTNSQTSPNTGNLKIYNITFDAFVTLSFDMYEPTDSFFDSVLEVRMKEGSTYGPRTRFDDGNVQIRLASTTQSINNAYSLDSVHHVDIVINLSGASGTYYKGESVASDRFDVWLDNQLLVDDAEFAAAINTINRIELATFSTSKQEINLDNVEVRNEAYVYDPSIAQSPVPSDMQTDVPIDQTLSWDAGIDLAAGNPVDVLEYYVYFDGPVTDPNLDDPNLLNGVTPATVAESGANGGSYPPPAGLSLGSTYIWRVDEKLNDGTIVQGANWVFTTVPPVPVFNDLLPVDVTAGVSENAELVVEATNPFTGDSAGLSYQWKFSADGVTYGNVPNGDGATLTLTGVQISDQGYYYCDVTIDSTSATASSKIAFLTVKQTLAYWPLDQANYVGGVHVDIVGGHNADPNGEPTFVTGAGPDALVDISAALIEADTSPTVGTWAPSETTGQFTVSAWIKWDGSALNTYGNGVLSKGTAYDAETMWMIRIRDVVNGNASVRFYNASGLNITVGGVVPPNTWTHVAAAYGSGQAELYINGESVGTDSDAGLGTGTATAELTIGSGARFPGAMDEVEILNYAVSDEEAATLYYQTSQEPVCLYPPPVDFNDDCKVDLQDFAIFAQSWIDCGRVPSETCNQ